MGISQGWRDVYGFTLSLQWVDVSDIAPGVYYLAGRADPNDVVVETDETNNGYAFRSGASTVPGHVAQDRLYGSDGSQVAVTLGVATYTVNVDEDPAFDNVNMVSYPRGDREYTIETAPDHGTLSVAVGSTFTSPSLTYTPDSGWEGTDSFTYSAADSESFYPLNPSVATVTIDVVLPPNGDPDVVNPGTQNGTVGDVVSLRLVVSDPDGDVVMFSSSSLPPGISAFRGIRWWGR